MKIPKPKYNIGDLVRVLDENYEPHEFVGLIIGINFNIHNSKIEYAIAEEHGNGTEVSCGWTEKDFVRKIKKK